MFSSALYFVCLLIKMDYAKTTQPVITKFGGKATHWPKKKRLAFGDIPHLGPNLGICETILPQRYWQTILTFGSATV